jgi:hypothetical protein
VNSPKTDAPRRVTVNGAQTELQKHPTSGSATVKLLPATFKSGGFQFRQLDRVGRVALFEKRKRPGGATSFEVVKIRRLPARKVFGVEYPPSEAMPATESWGTSGWTYCDVGSARVKFRALAEAQERPALQTHPPKNRLRPAGTAKDAESLE